MQDGCDNACTYCIVHVARGPQVSVPADAVLRESEPLVAAGVRELVLTGINLAAYRHRGMGLSDLCLLLRERFPHVRLRVGSVEPQDVDDALAGLLASQDGMVCRHLHLPLQSGSSRVLAQMARRYDAEGYMQLVERLRGRVPQLSLSTDVIVGFPGERDDDFRQTLDLVHACGFTKVHVFRYSPRAGTPAAQRADQVAPEAKAQRAAQLAALARSLRLDAARARVGTAERVLVEQRGRGMTESYFSVRTGNLEPGALVSCTLKAVDEEGAFHL